MNIKTVLIGSIMLLFNCCVSNYEKIFLAKHELEDFTQFKGVDMAVRGFDRQKNIVIYGYAPNLIKDSTNAGYFIITLNKENHQIIESILTIEEGFDKADLATLHELAQAFLKYQIPRLNVDNHGNAFIYLKDAETLALVQLMDTGEIMKKYNSWNNIKGNWYRAK